MARAGKWCGNSVAFASSKAVITGGRGVNA
jgi:hypothetical protein